MTSKPTTATTSTASQPIAKGDTPSRRRLAKLLASLIVAKHKLNNSAAGQGRTAGS